MGSWPGGIEAVTLFVEDLDTAKEFYGRAFGLPVTYEDDDSPPSSRSAGRSSIC